MQKINTTLVVDSSNTRKGFDTEHYYPHRIVKDGDWIHIYNDSNELRGSFYKPIAVWQVERELEDDYVLQR